MEAKKYTREECIALLREKQNSIWETGEERLPVRADFSNEEIIAQIAESNQSAVRRGNGNNGGITVKGMTDLSVRFSKCCSPVPGDDIVGFVTRGRGVTVHRTDCVNIINSVLAIFKD